MQDIYAFDVGDYGKLGLLRRLAKAGLNLGVVWWKTELGSPVAAAAALRRDRYCPETVEPIALVHDRHFTVQCWSTHRA